jgi:hypothetical protein
MSVTRTPVGADVDVTPRPTAAPRMVGVIWSLLIVNTLGPSADTAVIPPIVAQLVTTLALVVAFALALVINPRVQIRPSAFVLLLTLLAFETTISTVFLGPGFGAFARLFRLLLFVVTLWLLTPHWHDAMAFVRHHQRALIAVLASVVVGLVVAPGRAISPVSGRLSGIIWSISATEVAEYAAVLLGLTLLLWQSQPSRRWLPTLLLCLATFGTLLLTHTRTAMVAMLAGLVVSGLALATVSSRARRVVGVAILASGAIWAVFHGVVLAWFQRGQSAAELQGLTGRQVFWDNLLATPRTDLETLFGLGINHKSFDGLPIDSSWYTIYNEQGVVGVVIVAAICVTLVAAAVLRRPSTPTALAIFLITYCLVASYTEVGLGDASPYLLYLYMAAALLTTSPARRETAQVPHHG